MAARSISSAAREHWDEMRAQTFAYPPPRFCRGRFPPLASFAYPPSCFCCAGLPLVSFTYPPSCFCRVGLPFESFLKMTFGNRILPTSNCPSTIFLKNHAAERISHLHTSLPLGELNQQPMNQEMFTISEFDKICLLIAPRLAPWGGYDGVHSTHRAPACVHDL